MSISVNDGGILKNIKTFFINEDGVTRKLSNIHANDGGVLRKIYSAKALIPIVEKKIGDVVKIRENGTAVNYTIVHKGLPSSLYDPSCDGVWLLRQNVLPTALSWGINSKYLASNISSEYFGSNNYLPSISSDILSKIKTVKIPYRAGGINDVGYSGSQGASTKVFLLSGYELGLTNTDSTSLKYMGEDGAKLDYFLSGTSSGTAGKRRKAGLSGDITQSSTGGKMYWTRSPYVNGSNVDYAYGISNAGAMTRYSTDSEKYVRPAFILPYEDVYADSDGYVVVK